MIYEKKNGKQFIGSVNDNDPSLRLWYETGGNHKGGTGCCRDRKIRRKYRDGKRIGS